MLEHISELPDLILFWMNDVSVICVSRCEITCGTLSGKHMLTLIWMIMTGDSFKIILNWAVLAITAITNELLLPPPLLTASELAASSLSSLPWLFSISSSFAAAESFRTVAREYCKI